ncbi:MAG: type III-A CRISPR-associated protein Csm2 [Lachnospiraceae bacterium]|nr:type III-A CRISPR-associated protein Csm2 [Lachnospiraceae bacterium]MDE7307749.1 type III-A CRISPR-associated protein Csm2 [Lachnospiraceae bacterium]
MIITEQNYVEKAERAIKVLKNKKNEKTQRTIPMVTTSKIRNLLSIINDIYNEILNYQNEKLSEEICGRIDYLKVRFVYEAGRETSVKSFIEVTEILECLNEIKGSKKNFLLFSRYMEALVAYHKFYGGKEN